MTFASVVNAGQNTSFRLPRFDLQEECRDYIFSEKILLRQLTDIHKSLNTLVAILDAEKKETTLSCEQFREMTKTLMCMNTASMKMNKNEFIEKYVYLDNGC